MVCLGEMVSYLPIPGGHIKLAERFVNPALSFTMGWNYWYNWYDNNFFFHIRKMNRFLIKLCAFPPPTCSIRYPSMFALSLVAFISGRVDLMNYLDTTLFFARTALSFACELSPFMWAAAPSGDSPIIIPARSPEQP